MSLSDRDEESTGEWCKGTGSVSLVGVDIRLGMDSLLLAVVAPRGRTLMTFGMDAVLSECLIAETPLVVASLKLCGTLALVSSLRKLGGREESFESVEGDPLPLIICGTTSGYDGCKTRFVLLSIKFLGLKTLEW